MLDKRSLGGNPWMSQIDPERTRHRFVSGLDCDLAGSGTAPVNTHSAGDKAEGSMLKAHSKTDLSPSASQASVYTARSRYLTTTNAFREKLPPVPAIAFTVERDRAFEADAPTGAIPCDISDQLASPVPATTPLLLARYLRVRSGESLRMRLRATAGIYYVIRGAGESTYQADRLAWSQGDIFRIPGGETI